MKRILLLLALVASCTSPTFEEDLSSFLSTRASEPLKGTIWEHQTGDQYNRYLYFSEADVSLFYGLVEDGELQRWSKFYTAPYVYCVSWVETALVYPLWGNNEYVKTADVIKGDGYTIDLDGDEYTYYGSKVNEIEGQWMLIIASPMPWD